MCCGYSEEFRQVVSCADGSVSQLVFYNAVDTDDHLGITTDKWIQSVSRQERARDIYRLSICDRFQVVKVWDFDSGRQVFEFGGTPDSSVITCMTFDHKGRRYSTWSGVWNVLACRHIEIHNFISLQRVLVFADSSQVGATVVWRSGTSTMASA